MGQVPYGSTRTTAEIRRAIRNSKESLKTLAKRYGLNPKTVAKWRGRKSADDLPRGPKSGRHGKLTAEEEDIIVRFREHTLLPLDDCLYALQARIPHLTRSSLHRCLQRHGISRLTETVDAGWAIEQQTVPPGHLHIDTSTVGSADGSHRLFNAIDQASKFVFVRMGPQDDASDAAAFLRELVEYAPFRIERVVTIDAEPFVLPGGESEFAAVCRRHGIEHRLACNPHPWTRGRGARMGRMIKAELTVASETYLAELLREFVHAYNFRRRLKTLGGRTPFEALCRAWSQRPERFLRDPHHEMVGLEFGRS